MKKTATGFTIIELLIVIVVIAILSSISTVAYSGIRTRAEDSAIASKVRSIAKIIEMYGAANGGIVPHANWACIGYPEDFPAGNGYDADWCSKPSVIPTPAGYIHPVNPTLNAELETIVGRVPSSEIPEVVYGSYTLKGIYYDSNATHLGGKPSLSFYVKGNRESCPIGDKFFSGSTYTRCQYVFTHLNEP